MTPTAIILLAATLTGLVLRLAFILRDWQDYRHRAGTTR
jgi:hypothetical protein